VSNDNVAALAVDNGNGIYVAGTTAGPVFDGQLNPNLGHAAPYLTKYTADGARQWSSIWGPTNAWMNLFAVAVDNSTNIYTAGGTQGAFDGQSLVGTESPFLTKFDASGTKQWTRLWGKTNGFNYAAAVAVDGSSNIYVTGYTRGAGVFDGQAGSGEGFLTKLTATGARAWSRIFGSGTNDSPSSITVDSTGTNIYVAGQTEGSFGGQATPGYGAFLCKFDASGNLAWTRFAIASASGYPGVGCVAVDNSSNVVVSGLYDISTNHAFMARYTSGGSQLWYRSYATYADGISVDATGLIYRVGALQSGNIDNGFLVTKTSLSGTELSNVSLSGGSNDWASGIAVSKSGSVYVAGSTKGRLANLPSSTGYDNFLIAMNGSTQQLAALLQAGDGGMAGQWILGTNDLPVTWLPMTGTLGNGWVLRAINQNRVLLQQGTGGFIGLWALNGSGVPTNWSLVSGPIPGWIARGLDGNRILLQAGDGGMVGIWTLNSSNQPVAWNYLYPGISGLIARGLNGNRVLFQFTNGSLSGYWFLNGSCTITGWSPIDVGLPAGWILRAMTQDYMLLQAGDGGMAGIWDLDVMGNPVAWHIVNGPLPGWILRSLDQ